MSDIKLGVSQEQQCHYRPAQHERLLFTLPEQPINMALYQQLIQYNFRRSGDQLYTTYCQHCQACQSVRLEPGVVIQRKSQKRLWQKAVAAGWRVCFSSEPDSARYYPLYQAYIDAKHRDGSMWPANPEQMQYLWQSRWQQVMFVEQYLHEQLVAVTVVDVLSDACSAVYSFYLWPHKLSFGLLAIQALLHYCQQQQLPYLYLGYYVNDCAKMNYKDKFRPQQRFIEGKWLQFA